MAKLPKKLGELIDLAYSLRNDRLDYQRSVEARIAEMKEKEKEIADAIVNGFSKQEIESARGTVATASIKTTVSATVKDFPAVWAWAKKHDAIDLFYKRIVSSAYQERIDAGEDVPGVERFVNKELSLTKISSK